MDKITERELAKSAIANLVSLNVGIDLESAADTVNKVQEIIDDIEGNITNEFGSIDDVLKEYLGLEPTYRWIFVDTYIPVITGE